MNDNEGEELQEEKEQEEPKAQKQEGEGEPKEDGEWKKDDQDKSKKEKQDDERRKERQERDRRKKPYYYKKQKKERKKSGDWDDSENGSEKGSDAASDSDTDSRRDSLAPSETHLFLVEFLVDCVVIDCCAVDSEVLEGQTCLTLTFLNFPPMKICEKDFDPNKEEGYDKIRFNSGKSLMFAFNRKQCDRPPPLLLEITVAKKLEYEGSSCHVEIGTTKICISEIFRQIVDVAKFTPDKLPTSKAIKDCFMLVGSGKRTTGEVSVYVRLSCLGQNVVTEFQCGPDLQKCPVMFKSREGKKIYEFMGNEPEDEQEDGPAQNDAKKSSSKHPSDAGKPNRTRAGQGDAERYGKSVGRAYAEGNRVVLDIPDKSNRCRGEHNVDRYKVSNQAGDYKVTQNSMMDESRTKDGLTVSQLNSNPDQNCFVLKVGDKGMIPDRGKMILEFRTPKQKILPKVLPPYHEDIAVQTEALKKKRKAQKN